jgi:hypothetical protein
MRNGIFVLVRNSVRYSSGESWHNSVQINLTKRVTRGPEYQVYTWSKSLEDSQGEFINVSIKKLYSCTW